MEKSRYEKALESLKNIVEKIYGDLYNGEIPTMELPARTKYNIELDLQKGVWKYGNAKITRSAKKIDGAYTLLRTMYMMDFIREMIEQSKSSTLRELYYISEGWDLAKFHTQDESNRLAEDLEIVTKFLREDFKLRPEEDGATVIGNIT
ncbi:MAG: DNA topoisomerase VI, partial [Thermoplasmata archaeon]